MSTDKTAELFKNPHMCKKLQDISEVLHHESGGFTNDSHKERWTKIALAAVNYKVQFYIQIASLFVGVFVGFIFGLVIK